MYQTKKYFICKATHWALRRPMYKINYETFFAFYTEKYALQSKTYVHNHYILYGCYNKKKGIN